MQPRTLEQILGELNPVYEPQINSLRTRQSAIPGQIAEEEKGLGAKQENAFGDILNGARRRGLGFSGIPLSEQAKYTASEFLPAVARLKQSGREQAMSLEDAILGISERRNTLAQQIRGQEVDRAEQIRQYNETLAEQRRQFDLQQKAAARAASGAFSPSYGGGGAPAAKVGTPSPTWGADQRNQEAAYTDVQKYISQNQKAAQSDFLATLESANRGNMKDKYKIQLYQKANPDWFTPNALVKFKNGGSSNSLKDAIIRAGSRFV